MTNQTGLRAILDKLKLYVEVFRQALRMPLRDNAQPQRQGNPRSKEVFPEIDMGLPLEIGNELLITDEIVKLSRSLSNALGRVVIIDEISVEEHDAIKASAFGIQVNVDMETAEVMREAYLRREQAWSSANNPSQIDC